VGGFTVAGKQVEKMPIVVGARTGIWTACNCFATEQRRCGEWDRQVDEGNPAEWPVRTRTEVCTLEAPFKLFGSLYVD
jgi:hypothetical protein